MTNNYFKELPKDLKIIIIEYLEHPHDVLNLHKIIKLKNKDYKRVVCEKYGVSMKNFKCKFEFDFKQLYVEVLTDQLLYKTNLLCKNKNTKANYYNPNKHIILFLVLNGDIECNDIITEEVTTDKNNLFEYVRSKCSYKEDSFIYDNLCNIISSEIIPYIGFQLNIVVKRKPRKDI